MISATMSDTVEKLLRTAPEAAEMLSISQRSLWQLTKDGVIPCVRLGRSLRYDPADLRAWIEGSKQIGLGEQYRRPKEDRKSPEAVLDADGSIARMILATKGSTGRAGHERHP